MVMESWFQNFVIVCASSNVPTIFYQTPIGSCFWRNFEGKRV